MGSESLASQLDPLDRALLKALLANSGAWTPIDWNGLTAAEESAHARLLAAGLLEIRFDTRVSLRGRPETLHLRCQATGTGHFWEEVRKVCPRAWLNADGDFLDEPRESESGNAQIRLTDEGELAQQDCKGDFGWRVLPAIRGLVPRVSPGIRHPGCYLVEVIGETSIPRPETAALPANGCPEGPKPRRWQHVLDLMQEEGCLERGTGKDQKIANKHNQICAAAIAAGHCDKIDAEKVADIRAEYHRRARRCKRPDRPANNRRSGNG